MPLNTIYVFVNVHSNFMCMWNMNREVCSLHIDILFGVFKKRIVDGGWNSESVIILHSSTTVGVS